MAVFDIILPNPQRRHDRHFPIGDITDARNLERTDSALKELDVPDRGRLLDLTLDRARMALGNEYWLHGAVPRPILLRLFQTWAGKLQPHEPNTYKLAWTGFFAGLSVARYLLPPLAGSFGDEVRPLERLSADELNRNVDGLWQSMSGFPAVYVRLASLADLLIRALAGSEEEELLIRASVALMFSLSAESRLRGYSRNFSPIPNHL